MHTQLTITAQQLLDKLEAAKSDNDVMIDALDLFQLGRIMASLCSDVTSSDQAVYTKLQHAYQRLMETLSIEYCHEMFHDLCLGLEHVLVTLEEDEAILDAIQAVEQLAANSSKAAKSMASSTKATLSSSHLLTQNETSQATAAIAQKLLALILLNMSADVMMESIQSLQQQHEARWNDFVAVQPLEWKQSVLQVFCDDAARQDYLRVLLFPVAPIKQQLLAPIQPVVETKTRKQPASIATSTAAAEAEMQRRIDLVRQVLPDLGEGFVEAVLSVTQGDVERTVATLLDDGSTLPATLQHLDRNLPRIRSASRNDETMRANAVLKTKEMLQEAEAQAMREQLALETVMQADNDLYNDDYDDQWDNDHEYDAPNVGLYDNDEAETSKRSGGKSTATDYESVLLYNKALKQVEADQQFWQETANTNIRATGNGNDIAGSDSKTFRGPDKLRGGRVPGRGGGGGRGRGMAAGRGGPQPPQSASEATTSGQGSSADQPATTEGDSKTFSKRRKENQMAKRKDKQRQAMAKRSGA
ncbi:hypothetical protein MPSEU_000747600 [Mayamaea pseudoterrestris]|nr:hypothetical protein MPSEU_000747600 [Mayamaea pseudoterrestris]